MDDASGMSGGQRRCDLHADIEDLPDVEAFPSHPIPQTLTLHQLGCDEQRAAVTPISWIVRMFG